MRAGEGYGVVVEYLQGIPLGLHVVFGGYTPAEVGEVLGTLARQLHATQTTAGHDWKATFLAWAQWAATHLSREDGERIVALVASVPASNALLHGDLHVSNVVSCAGEMALIDMETMGYGHPAFDLAIMRVRVLAIMPRLGTQLGFSDHAAQAAPQALWQAALACYFADATPAQLEALDARLAVLAALEMRYQTRNPGAGGGAGLEPEALRDDAAFREHLSALLSQVDDPTTWVWPL